MITKKIDALTEADLKMHPVWEYANELEDETYVRPIANLPVEQLNGRVVGTVVKFASGHRVWAVIGNVEIGSAELTKHFLTISFLVDGKWFTLARYHDHDFQDNGPTGLAHILGVSIADIFPIEYDIRKYVVGESPALIGQITERPNHTLTREELIALAVPRASVARIRITVTVNYGGNYGGNYGDRNYGDSALN